MKKYNHNKDYEGIEEQDLLAPELQALHIEKVVNYE